MKNKKNKLRALVISFLLCTSLITGGATGAQDVNAAARSDGAAGVKTGAVSLDGLTIMAIDSSLAYFDGRAADLVPDFPGLSAYLNGDKTYVPVEFLTKGYGLTGSLNRINGSYRLRLGPLNFLTLAAEEYDAAYGDSGEMIVFAPLRIAIEKLGLNIYYYDGLIVICEGSSPFDAKRDAAQLAELRASLTGAVPVASAGRFEKLMRSAELNFYNGAYAARYGAGSSKFAFNDFDLPMLSIPDGLVQSEAAAAPAERGGEGPRPERAPVPGTGVTGGSDAGAWANAGAADDAGFNTSAGMQAESDLQASADEYSRTNIQVEGVDESDVVKTDGRYIYQVNERRVLIVDAYPPSGMKIVGEVDFSSRPYKQLRPLEMYVDGDTLIVIGSSSRDAYPFEPSVSARSLPERDGAAIDLVEAEWEMYDPYYSRYEQSTRALIFDISDKSSPVLKRDTEIDGYYKTSRKIGASLYLVTNKSMNYYRPRTYYNYYDDAPAFGGAVADGEGSFSDANRIMYSDSALEDDGYAAVNYDSIYYFPGCIAYNYLIITGIDTRDVKKPVSVESLLDYGNNVYVSPDYLYVATQKNYRFSGLGMYGPASTDIHRFKLDGCSVSYDVKGTVNGTVLNQFSMDEWDGRLRVATTSDNYGDFGYETRNNIYILDAGLNVTGRLEGLAPGELIYSVRYMGAKAYVVTFKTVDPLFVVDLSDHNRPKLLGALKIPGYSDYLHPYDENHIIGFGKDTAEYDHGYGPQAYYQGMKIALFDVTDVENPVELFVEYIGDRGTDSELLRNHRALLFSRERGLLAFPVTVMTIPQNRKTGNLAKDITEYGQFEFQGAYVYNLNLKDGFSLAGKITHISPQEYKYYGSGYRSGENAVERLLYIRDSLYALSKSYITANDLNELSRQTGRLSLLY